MKKPLVLLFVLIPVSFCLGFASKALLSERTNETNSFKKVTGIGGIFFKCEDPKKIREWYQVNLGLNTNAYGAVFEWYQGADSTRKGFSQWSPFNESTTYFEPSTKDFMINYRVDDLEALVVELRKNGVTIIDTMQVVDYGKFIHILDPEGNNIELWEPNDLEYENLGKQMGCITTK